jgi:protein-S-isoprenylcysteine O-methyltransferase Ste14
MRFLEHRIPPPLVFILTAAIMWIATRGLPLQLGDVWRFGIAALFFMFGCAFAITAFRAFDRAKTTINPVRIEEASSLVESGVYRYSRNPMYLALTLLLVAWAVYLATPWAFLGPLAFMLFITRFQILPEERVLRVKFGPVFQAYEQKVRRWI